MISTFSPMAASAVPRLMAVVVLPTPPFWLARAKTLGRAGSVRGDGSPSLVMLAALCEGSDPDDASQRISPTRQELGIESPGFRRLGQFTFRAAAFGEQAERAGCQQTARDGEHIRQGCEGARRHHVYSCHAREQRLGPSFVDGHRRSREPRHVAKEGALT